MGRQIYFYLEPRDLVPFERALLEPGDTSILHHRSPNPEPRVVDSLVLEEGGQPWLFFSLVRTEDMPAIVMRHVPAQQHWTIDVLRSPVVEFSRGRFDGSALHRGRLYYVDSFYDEHGRSVTKGEPFRTWAKALFGRAKRPLKKQGGDYLGPIAEARLASGEIRLVSL